jgi:SPP1 family phage portal protein
MFYEISGKNVELGGEITTEDILKDIIETDQESQRKIEMTQGVNYYATRNDILNRDFRDFYVDTIKYTDYNKSNEMIVNNLHKKLVDQKQGYISSKAVVVKIDDDEFADKINELLGDEFNDMLGDWIKNASNKGTEELQPFVNEDGDFDYCLIPSEQIIYITDTTYQKNVEQAIRYYVMEFVEDGEVKERKRVEVWDKEKVTRYQEIDSKDGTEYQFIYPNTFGVEINPQYHWYSYNTNFTDKSQLSSFNDADAIGVEGHSWGKVPMVCLKNNSEMRSDLMPIKRYIDGLDVVSSGFLNDLKDIQLAIWVLRT